MTKNRFAVLTDRMKFLTQEFKDAADKAIEGVNTCTARRLAGKMGLEQNHINCMMAGLFLRLRGWTPAKKKTGDYRQWRRGD